VPMLVVPLSSDQPMQARLVERAGVGLAVLPGGDFAGALKSLREDPAFRERARSLAAEFQSLDGAGETVRRLEQLC